MEVWGQLHDLTTSPLGKNPLNRRQGAPHSLSVHSGEKKNFLPPPGFGNHTIPHVPQHTNVTNDPTAAN